MKVSIIMSTYKEYANRQLHQAVDSVLAQTYKNWELIIIGDCAPDGTAIEQWVKSLNDERIFFKNLSYRAGWSSPGTGPKQEGISCATGVLAAFLDADNEYFPRHLECSVEQFLADPTLDLVYGDTLVRMSRRAKTPLNPPFVRWERKNNGFIMGEIQKIFMQFIWKKPEWNDRCAKQLQNSNFLDMSEPVFTRAAYDGSIGLTTAHHAADWNLWRAFLAASYNNFKHSAHLGLIYSTYTLKHHLQYIGLMLAWKSGIRYTAENLKWMQKSIRKRFEKKYT